jgi:pimeloyl-ACP methyl ester carboxylesterase
MKRIEVSSHDGVRIACTLIGEGEPTLVFIHGGFGDSSVWSRQVEAFSGEYRVVTLDLAGHGASGGDRASWSLEAFGEDVRSAVEALAPGRVVLIGHSMGGPVALDASRRMPERLAGIIAVDTLHDAGREWNSEAWTQRMETFRNDFPGACRRMMKEMFREDTDLEIVSMVESRIRRFPPDRALSILGIFASYDMASAMQAVEAPIRGLNADLWPTNVEGNRRYAPGYDAVIMKGVGHFPMLERPEEFNRHLARILDELLR